MKMKLGDFLLEVNERTTRNNEYPVLTASKECISLQNQYFKKPVASKDNTGYKVIHRGQFTYRAMSDTGNFYPNILESVNVGIVSPAYPVFEITNKELVLPKYLKYYFKSPVFQFGISKFVQGTTRANLHFNKMKTIEIDVPSVDEQYEVVNCLSKVTSLMEKKKKEIVLLNTMLKARFVEMFGDPVKNDKGFDSKLGSDVFKLSNGKFVPESKRFDSGIPVYGGNGISWYTDEILFEKETIVVGRVGFQSGNVHLVGGPLWISDNAMYISNFYDDGYDLQFLFAVMEQIDFTRFQDAGDLKKITQKPFMQMHYIKPPIEMQQEYNAFVTQVDKSKAAIQKSIDETQLLYDSLMQKYFG